MSPIAFVVVFCAVMTLVAVVRIGLSRSEGPAYGEPEAVALVTIGVTLLAALWLALEEGWLTDEVRLALGIGGLFSIFVGTVVLSRVLADEPHQVPF